ncbi:hypothetical protein B296_00015055 [Ensete ventricosum]|uniref:Uncharacterized protein n=1 Tax=Ensete ventricosum TaxID=4639 RepID=A0A427B775_ENSVE|nr:hypothetical protein B296_00015055 [Ensete ventricosum]
MTRSMTPTSVDGCSTYSCYQPKIVIYSTAIAPFHLRCLAACAHPTITDDTLGRSFTSLLQPPNYLRGLRHLEPDATEAHAATPLVAPTISAAPSFVASVLLPCRCHLLRLHRR